MSAEDDEVPSDAFGDVLCQRAEVVRGLAVDLAGMKDRKARGLLERAAECVIAQMRLPRARVLKIVPGSKTEPKKP